MDLGERCDRKATMCCISPEFPTSRGDVLRVHRSQSFPAGGCTRPRPPGVASPPTSCRGTFCDQGSRGGAEQIWLSWGIPIPMSKSPKQPTEADASRTSEVPRAVEAGGEWCARCVCVCKDRGSLRMQPLRPAATPHRRCGEPVPRMHDVLHGTCWQSPTSWPAFLGCSPNPMIGTSLPAIFRRGEEGRQ